MCTECEQIFFVLLPYYHKIALKWLFSVYWIVFYSIFDQVKIAIINLQGYFVAFQIKSFSPDELYILTYVKWAKKISL